jgi:hypothetical protein
MWLLPITRTQDSCYESAIWGPLNEHHVWWFQGRGDPSGIRGVVKIHDGGLVTNKQQWIYPDGFRQRRPNAREGGVWVTSGAPLNRY